MFHSFCFYLEVIGVLCLTWLREIQVKVLPADQMLNYAKENQVSDKWLFKSLGQDQWILNDSWAWNYRFGSLPINVFPSINARTPKATDQIDVEKSVILFR